MEAADHNWLQGTLNAIVVDLGAGNASDQAIVFNSIDHLGVEGDFGGDPQKLLWNNIVEGIEFTVYATNNLADALAAAATPQVFSAGGTSEAGVVPGVGAGSTFEQGALDFVFEDGWADFGNAQEGDDYASVWQFTQPYRYIAVFSDFTDPFVGDGFRSFDNELDAIGRFLKARRQPSRRHDSRTHQPHRMVITWLCWISRCTKKKKINDLINHDSKAVRTHNPYGFFNYQRSKKPFSVPYDSSLLNLTMCFSIVCFYDSTHRANCSMQMIQPSLIMGLVSGLQQPVSTNM